RPPRSRFDTLSFFFNHPPTPELYSLSLHDALPISDLGDRVRAGQVLVELDREKLDYNLEQQKAALVRALAKYGAASTSELPPIRSEEHTSELQSLTNLVCRLLLEKKKKPTERASHH